MYSLSQDVSKMLIESQKRIDMALELHKPPFVWFAYSGGSDSAVIVQLAKMIDINVPWGIMTIETGLQSPMHIERVRSDIKKAGLQLTVFKGLGLEWYVEDVLQYGYGYTPNQHVIYYRMLKEKAIDKSIQAVKTKYHQRVVSVTGVRREESNKRKNTPIIYHRRGARVTLNLIADYTESDKNKILSLADWYSGKTTEDCMCNWHGNYSADSDMNNDMELAIKEIDKSMTMCGLWRYGERPTNEQIAIVGNVDNIADTMPSDSYCVSCISKALR